MNIVDAVVEILIKVIFMPHSTVVMGYVNISKEMTVRFMRTDQCSAG